MFKDKTLKAIGINCASAFTKIMAIRAFRVGTNSGAIGDFNSDTCLIKMCAKITSVATLVISKNATMLAWISTASPRRWFMCSLVYSYRKVVLSYDFVQFFGTGFDFFARRLAL